MEEFKTYSSNTLIHMRSECVGWYTLSRTLADVEAELDRRCNEVFEWDEGRVCIKPTNDFVTVHQTLWIEDNEPIHNIKDYYIEAPHEFAALFSYFTSKPRT